MPKIAPRTEEDYRQLRKIGGRIREARTEQGKTQREFAALLGVSAFATISAMERGENGVSATQIQAIAQFTGYPVAWFLDPRFEEKLAHWPQTRIEWLTMAGGDRKRAELHFALDQLFMDAEKSVEPMNLQKATMPPTPSEFQSTKTQTTVVQLF